MANRSPLTRLRSKLHAGCTLRADALLALGDAVLTHPGPVHSFPELSLQRAFPSTHHNLYDAVREGHVDPAAFLATALSMPGSHTRVFTLDETAIPRPYAPTSPGRTMVRCSTRGTESVHTPGWKLAALVEQVRDCSSWVRPLRTDIVVAACDSTEVALTQIRAVCVALAEGDPTPSRALFVLDSGYDAPGITHLLRKSATQAEVLIRLRSDRVMYQRPGLWPTPASSRGGRPRRNGPRVECAGERPEPSLTSAFTHGVYGDVAVEAWTHVHPKLARRGVMEGASTEELTVEGTLVRVVLAVPRSGRGEIWLWYSGTPVSTHELYELWWAYTRRYDIEHFFKFTKLTLGLGAYHPISPQAQLTWARVLDGVYLQLLLQRPDLEDQPRPWEQPRLAGRLSPGRVRREVLRHWGSWWREAGVAKPRKGGTGTPSGTIRAPRSTYPVQLAGQKVA